MGASRVIQDDLLCLKREWVLGNPGDARFAVHETGTACGVAWGATWHLHWLTEEDGQALWQSLGHLAIGQVLVRADCPGLEGLPLQAASRSPRWLGFSRHSDHARVNPAPAGDDKHSTAGYVTISSDLPPAALDHYGGPVAGLLTGIGIWHVLQSEGTTRGWILSAFPGSAGCLLEALHVTPRFRHAGCATRLVEAAAAGRSCRLLAEERPGTREFWADRGFRCTGEYLLLEPAISRWCQASVRA